ncbi:MAG: hypothetical protein HYX27_18360 [Acidobacteria bacterium]|nr:hypothetical protein [Acidobacteriota bacterium]
METNSENTWVAERMASIAPEWLPDRVKARGVLDGRLAAPRRYSRVWITAGAAAGLAVALVALPAGRAIAQELWFRLFLHRVDVVRLDLSRIPLDTHVNAVGGPDVVGSLEEAEQKAGFRPIFPAEDRLGIAVIGRISVRQTIHVRELERALEKVGARDVKVPAEWDGVTLRAEIGPMVAADYPGDVQVLEAKPIEMLIPSGFPLARFAEAAFRTTGISWMEARTLGEKFAANPAWLIDVQPDEEVRLREVALAAGPGLLVHDFDDAGAVSRVTVILSTPERIFVVSGPTEERSLRIANLLR